MGSQLMAGRPSGIGQKPARLRQQPRGPRPEELALLSRLALGPQPVSDGPLGRCLKRGWCRLAHPSELLAYRAMPDRGIVYAITDRGRSWLCALNPPAGEPAAGTVRRPRAAQGSRRHTSA